MLTVCVCVCVFFFFFNCVKLQGRSRSESTVYDLTIFSNDLIFFFNILFRFGSDGFWKCFV